MRDFFIAAMLFLTVSVTTCAADDTPPFKITSKRSIALSDALKSNTTVTVLDIGNNDIDDNGSNFWYTCALY